MGNWALHPCSLVESVAMEMSKTVYPTLMWLGGRGSGQVIKPVDLPLLPDSTPAIGSPPASIWVAGSLTSVLPGPAHHSPPWVQPACLLSIYSVSARLSRSQHLPAESWSVILTGNRGHHMRKSRLSFQSTQTSTIASPRAQPCRV